MKVVVGLGNPGEKYKNTRHNVGFMVVDVLAGEGIWKLNKKIEAEICEIKPTGRRPVVLVKPMTFMNESGRAVQKIISYFKFNVSDLYVVHDDLDIELGKYKIQKGKGPKTHNGVLSVEEVLGTKDFWRVRVGVENRVDRNVGGEEFTLQEFGKQEREVVDGVIEEVVGILKG